jgi:ABC-2 type transport system ATP-binding protein
MAHIELNSVSIEFPIYNIDARSLKKRLISFSTGGAILKDAHQAVVVKALDNVNIKIEHNDSVGLIGCNGAGKSTLLRLLAGIYEPTHGTLKVDGKISSILDMSLGLNPEATGYENIIMRGILLGFTKKQIKAKLEEIADFTELGDYLSAPVRTYSTGMMVRLAFGVVTSIEPEILLLDEIVGAGDANFIQKARQRLSNLIKASNIVVLSSHSLDIIEQLCNKVLIMHKGQIKFFGECKEGIERYKNHSS